MVCGLYKNHTVPQLVALWVFLTRALLVVMQVAFFLPQLVQLLRGDGNGMIQRFLFAAAARSNVFAYNLVCILKVS